MRVSPAEFVQNYGALSDKARTEPVTITRDGQDEFVLLSIAEFRRLTRDERRALWPEELSDEEIAAIEAAEVPAEHSHLDVEVAGWRP